MSVLRHSSRLRKGEVFPPFLYVSHHQLVQPPLPGLLGGRAPASSTPSTRRPSASSSAKRSRWATSSSASSAASRSCTRTCSTCSPSSRTATSRSSRTATSSRDERAERMRRDRQRHATDQRRRHARSSATNAAAGRACSRRRCRACRTASTRQGLHGRLHVALQDEHRRPAPRSLGRSADRDGRDVHVVPRLPADGPAAEFRPLPDTGAVVAGTASSSSRCGRRSPS